jgi:hypothetical protein
MNEIDEVILELQDQNARLRNALTRIERSVTVAFESNWVDIAHRLRDENDALRAEVEALTTLLTANEKQECDEIARLRAEVEALRYALNRYGKHTMNCNLRTDMGHPHGCDCGLDAALAARRK